MNFKNKLIFLKKVTFNSSRKKMTSILIGNLTWWTSEDDIRSALDPEDPIDIEIFTKKSNGKSKGYARLTFIDESAKARAKLVFGRTLILSRVLEVVEDSAENVGKFESRFGPETDSETSNELDCLGVYDEPKVFRRYFLFSSTFKLFLLTWPSCCCMFIKCRMFVIGSFKTAQIK